MNLLHCLTKPYYVYRPKQILRRLQYERSYRTKKEFRWIELPWGLRMFVSPADDLGQALNTTGVNDLMVTESIFRLLDEGETGVDVGANVGYTTSIMAAKVNPSGQVISFEPHPRLFEEISRHVEDWQKNGGLSHEVVKLFNAAVSREAGWATLIEPEAFLSNRGRSCLDTTTSHEPESPEAEARRHSTKMMVLDEVLENVKQVGLLKVDVEGHEEEVFAGSVKSLAAKKIRDIVFEEFDPYPAKTHQLLESYGYQIFNVEEQLMGPHLLAADKSWKAPKYVPPNYLATCEPKRLKERFQSRGWQCLK